VPLAGDPADPGGVRITDDSRVRASLPTIQHLVDAGTRVVVCAHLGRPKGAPEERYSLRPVALRLAELLQVPVAFATDTVGDVAKDAVAGLGDGDVVLLENLRFEAAETSKDDAERGAFADRLASLADAFVSDGFGVVHRKHASVYDVARRLPSAAGGLVLAEIAALERLTVAPQRPYAVLLGGAKVSDKLGVIDHLLSRCDRLLIGGGMAFTFLAAQGHGVGRSLLEADQVDTVRGYLERAAAARVEVVLPVDVVAADAVTEDASADVVDVAAIPADRIGVDIGPRSAQLFAERLADVATVFWNGPMGVFELASFSEGTRAVAVAVAGVSGLSVVGGGDSAAAVHALGLDPSAFGHISTGGGASLEFLEGRTLPGLAVLADAPSAPEEG
jgi:phosphoglycerate kinase